MLVCTGCAFGTPDDDPTEVPIVLTGERIGWSPADCDVCDSARSGARYVAALLIPA